MCKISDLSETDDINNVLAGGVGGNTSGLSTSVSAAGNHYTRGQNTIIIIIVQRKKVCNKEL